MMQTFFLQSFLFHLDLQGKHLIFLLRFAARFSFLNWCASDTNWFFLSSIGFEEDSNAMWLVVL